MLAIGVKGHVPWPGTGRDPCERYGVGVEHAGARIEVPDIDLVSAEIDAEHVITIEIGEDLVRVRAFLAGGIGPGPVADTLKVVGYIADRTVAVNGKT